MHSSVIERISLLRFALICAIVFIHVPIPAAIEWPNGGSFSLLCSILCNGLFRVTVPMLTAISGYLLFKTALDLNLPALVKKKSLTLLVPLLIWNLPLVVGLYYIESKGITGHAFAVPAYPFNAWNWTDITLGLTRQPANFPLYFLRDLFVISMMAPLIGWFLRNAPVAGLALVVAIFYPNLDGYLVSRDTMPINFYIGGLAAIQSWNLRALDRYWPACLAAIIVSAIVIGYGNILDIRWFTGVAPFLVWPVASVLLGTPASAWMGRMSKSSFAIFLSHAPLLVVFWVAFEHFGSEAYYPLFWLVAPFVAIAAALAIRKAAYALMPRAASLAYGAR